MKCKELELVLEHEGLEPLPADARVHLADCAACQNLLSDFAAIVDAARELPAEIDPPARLWTSLRAQLEKEKIIRDGGKSSWWDSAAAFFRSPAVATAVVGLILLLAVGFELYQQPLPPGPIPPAYAETAATLATQEKGVAHIVRARAGTSPVDASLSDNLEIVNKFIADCELRVRQVPDDDIAREYLSGAYQQKAQLLSTMMERNGGGD